ncbi:MULTISPECIES: cytochrome c oxidase assembly protein [Rhodomicrobium]|uniref:cytochrome c oxidase assembly protein n=1 Tax=Rhodomicrobium TaxID=1068 RepID=UPI000B4B6FAF|nr:MULTISPECIES: cytochrome c oxidase assembly protein [Rhodomicrobium]
MSDEGRAAKNAKAGAANKRVAASLVLFTALMLGMAFAAVPLYRLFCQATGYAGTTKRAEAPSAKAIDRMVTVRFDASVSSSLGWSFQPVQRELKLRLGENTLAFYHAKNLTDEPVTGVATFNVTPEIAGSYFNKVECFCFTEQTLAAGQTVDMPVSFFVDPAILDDPSASHVEEITLSYTFFKANTPDRPASEGAPKGAASRQLENGTPPG